MTARDFWDATPRQCFDCGEWLPLEAFPQPSGVYAWVVTPRGAERCRDCSNFWDRNTPAERERARTLMRERRAAGLAETGWSTHADRAAAYGVPSEPWDRREVFAANGGQCVYCDAPATAVDHYEPLAAGGPNIRANLVPACTPCNASKNATDPRLWLYRHGARTPFARRALDVPAETTASEILANT